MFAAQIKFAKNRNADEEALIEESYWLLGTWYKNGQIVSDHWPLAKTSDGLIARVLIPAINELNNRFANRYVREALRRYEKLTSMRPGIFVLGPHPESAPPCTCSNRPGYILSKQTARLSGLANRSTRRSAFSNSEIMRRDQASDIYSSSFVQCVHTRPMSLALIAA